MNSETHLELNGLSLRLSQLVAQAAAKVVTVEGSRHASASGYIWKSDLVVTAAHRILREDGLRIILPDGKRVNASLKGLDRASDIALLALAEPQPTTSSITPSSNVNAGQLAIAIGRDTDGEVCSLLTMIGTVGGPWRTWGGGKLEQRIRIDRMLYPGFSGGPLLDANGNVIGMNTSGLSRRTGIVVPISAVDRIAEELRVRGRIARGYLGVATQPVKLPESIASKLTPQRDRGLIVLACEKDGPSDRAGVLIGDVLVAMGDQTITAPDHIHALLDETNIGKELSASIIRGGNPLTLSVTIGERQRHTH